METIYEIAALRDELKNIRMAGKKIGFVPTMGNLHEGHISLVHEALKQADIVVSSIFVNPLQFGANEDLDNYPKTLENDQQLLEDNGCHILFTPSVKEMYPNGQGIETIVEVPALSNTHCGASRPGHFRGVATVVTKLFGIVQPDFAVFGMKDFQQLAVIRRMTADLSLPVEIIGVPTARNSKGLALSSRNGYLDNEQLDIATQLFATLNWLKEQIEGGDSDYSALEEAANKRLEDNGFSRDYVHICSQSELLPANENDQDLVILAAAQLGPARLIDNLAFSLS
ncbi:pantoate--beta-alanine ligase [Motiliproteus sp. MSK22-1]|uniref:pantoate--beta-alanine ligase n=1 Tax=Motiliproteus sp. MSK22-1 TaxID=1897630 RepID=UPI00097679BE|nr:pantoate--beta-alanine ligase [Motiliproteus sp. MSK22-1]OMH32044.1 pantoate--beta-alanine ligase [Motiliproteus sp. MSK22-1]